MTTRCWPATPHRIRTPRCCLQRFSEEPYGLGISLLHPEFVKFVNGVLAQIKADGHWKTSYDKWLMPALGKAPAPPVAVYGRPIPPR